MDFVLAYNDVIYYLEYPSQVSDKLDNSMEIGIVMMPHNLGSDFSW